MLKRKGVEKEGPAATDVPPVAVVYQLIVPVEAVAISVTIPDSHLAAEVVVVIVGIEFIVASTAVRAVDVQLALVAST